MIIHSAAVTPANVAACHLPPDLLRGEETRVWGDQAYRGQRSVIVEHAPRARDFTNRRYRHNGVVDEKERVKNRRKSKVRAKVEHAFYCAQRSRETRPATSRRQPHQNKPLRRASLG